MISCAKYGERDFRLIGSFAYLVLLTCGCSREGYSEESWDGSVDLGDASPRDTLRSDMVDTGSDGKVGSEAGHSDVDGKPGPTGGHSPCLDMEKLISVLDVPDGVRKPIRVPNIDTAAYDMREVTIVAEPTTHLVDFENPANICVTGVSVIAKYPVDFTVNWENVKVGNGANGPYDVGGLHTSYPRSGTTTFDRVYVEGVEDGLMLARRSPCTDRRMDGKCMTYDTTQGWELRDSYLKNVIDDAIENDGYRSGRVSNVLSEGTHMFYSARNDQGDDLHHTLVIEDSVIDFACKPDARDKLSVKGFCPRGTSTQRVFKLAENPKIRITIKNTIIHQPAYSREGPSFTCLPTREDGYDVTYDKVTIVWTAGVSYPCSLKDTPGVVMTTDPNTYNSARADWLSKHGCSTDGTGCQFLQKL